MGGVERAGRRVLPRSSVRALQSRSLWRGAPASQHLRVYQCRHHQFLAARESKPAMGSLPCAGDQCAIVTARGFFACRLAQRVNKIGPIPKTPDVLILTRHQIEGMGTNPRIMADVEGFRGVWVIIKALCTTSGSASGGRIGSRPKYWKSSTGSPTRRARALLSSGDAAADTRLRDANVTRVKGTGIACRSSTPVRRRSTGA